MTMNLKEGVDDSVGAKFDNLIRSDYHVPVRSSSYKGRRSCHDVKETVVFSTALMHEKDDLMQKEEASIEE
ncbi:hypothetical protein B296_00019193 [Ensete ventricosum]|uniref:Uncharacterized protein n=1 Tax=Ensete ventricosum TaxID=4639 RepID=A0A427AYB2_ENSVE|nr:hypothetical protein B296_00019193 [Ensete ventricosum]